MNVLLVQPPQPIPAIDGDSDLFSPPWYLMCVQTFLKRHTRHLGYIIDTRLFSDLETELVHQIETIPGPLVIVINTTSLALGQTAAVLEITKRHYPDISTILCGQHPSQFPHVAASTPRVDYAMCGDPEPILRNLLDTIDVKQRHRRIPGLVMQGDEEAKPYWLSNLRSLSVGEFTGVFWPAYKANGVCRALASLTRGHSGTRSDRAFGYRYEPFRQWPMEILANNMQRMIGTSITEVFLNDAPGVWSPDMLKQWCRILCNINNSIPWGLRMLPAVLMPELLDTMTESLCRKVEFIIPSCDPDTMERYGCNTSPGELMRTLNQMEKKNIDVQLQFWMGGPDENPGEQHRVAAMIKNLRFCTYSIRAFPFLLDAPLYEEMASSTPAPHLEDWIKWARDPWRVERPVPLWNGQEGLDLLQANMAKVRSSLNRNPLRLVKHLANRFERFRSRNWIEEIESRSIGMLPPLGPDK